MLQDLLFVVEIVFGILLTLVDPVALMCQHLIVFMNKSSQALMFTGKEPFPTLYVDSQKEGEVGLKKSFSHFFLLTYSALFQMGKNPLYCFEFAGCIPTKAAVSVFTY